MRKSRQEEQLVAAGHTVATVRKENEPRLPSPQLPFHVLYNPDPLPREGMVLPTVKMGPPTSVGKTMTAKGISHRNA